jgi:hypothetical protein
VFWYWVVCSIDVSWINDLYVASAVRVKYDQTIRQLTFGPFHIFSLCTLNSSRSKSTSLYRESAGHDKMASSKWLLAHYRQGDCDSLEKAAGRWAEELTHLVVVPLGHGKKGQGNPVLVGLGSKENHISDFRVETVTRGAVTIHEMPEYDMNICGIDSR